jgi:hypothetical protein
MRKLLTEDGRIESLHADGTSPLCFPERPQNFHLYVPRLFCPVDADNCKDPSLSTTMPGSTKVSPVYSVFQIMCRMLA